MVSPPSTIRQSPRATACANAWKHADREPITVKDVFAPDGEHTDEKLRGMAGFVAHRAAQRGKEVSPVAIFGDPQITAAKPGESGLEVEFTCWLAFGVPTDVDSDDRGLGPI